MNSVLLGRQRSVLLTRLLTAVILVGMVGPARALGERGDTLLTSQSASAPLIQVLYYGPGVMERVFRVHQTADRTGDHVPGLVRQPGVDCLVAVNWNTHNWVYHNTVLTIDFWDRVERRWERHSCQVSDWQRRRDSTGTRQRFEIDWGTAAAVHAVPNNTIARLVAVHTH